MSDKPVWEGPIEGVRQLRADPSKVWVVFMWAGKPLWAVVRVPSGETIAISLESRDPESRIWSDTHEEAAVIWPGDGGKTGLRLRKSNGETIEWSIQDAKMFTVKKEWDLSEKLEDDILKTLDLKPPEGVPSA